jgi:hypothetical protein
MKKLNVTVTRNDEILLDVDLYYGELIEDIGNILSIDLDDLNDCIKSCWRSGYGANWSSIVDNETEEKFELTFFNC